jgi:hypothetical protein
MYRRGGSLFLHRSVERDVRAGRYRLADVSYVDDSPLEGADPPQRPSAAL